MLSMGSLEISQKIIRQLRQQTAVSIYVAALFLAVQALRCDAADNPLVTLNVTVTTGARWVPYPSVASLPPYFAADLSTMDVRVTPDPAHMQLVSKVQDALTMRLRAMQSNDPAALKAADLDNRPIQDWIVIPKFNNPQQIKQFAAVSNSLVQMLVSFGDSSNNFIASNGADPGPISPSQRITLTSKLHVLEISDIRIVIKTTGTGDELISTFPLSQLWSDLREDAPELKIPVEVHYYSSNCNSLSPTEVAERAAKSALSLYKSLYALGLTINSFDIGNTLPSYQHAIKVWMDSVNNSLVMPRPTAKWDPHSQQLIISNFPTVYSVVITPSEDFEALRNRLQTRSCRDLVGFPLNDEVATTYEYLVKQDPAVKDLKATYAGGSLTLNITPQPTLASLNVTGGASYNNQYGATGKLSALGQDLIPRGRHYDIGNTLQASYNGGGTSQTATLSESLIKAIRDPMPKIDFYSLAIAGNFLQNQDDRFGAIVPGQTVTVSETQASAALKLSYDSFSIFEIADSSNLAPPSRSRNRNKVLIPVGFMFEKYTANSNGGTYQSMGNILQLSISPDYLYTHDFDDAGKTKGWSEADLELKAEYIKGLGTAGYVGFDRYLGSAAVTTYFGLRRTRQFFAQGQYGVGSLSAGGPIVRVFQLGGTQYVPGLQFGEAAGQTLGFMQVEAGIDFVSVFELFKHSLPKDFTLFDINRSYVEMQYSRASVNQSESIGSVAGFANAFKSFGPACTLGKLKNNFDLTVGYMYSPQSTIHPHGTLYIGVTIYDFRMR